MFRLVLVLAALISSLGVAPATSQPVKIRVVLVGDSTVTDKAGWGLGFARAFDAEKVEVVNLSAGGRSSKSYRDEGLWTKALAARGDVMLIQFGHNDAPGKGPERETDPSTTFKDNMVRYAREAQAGGFRPVIVTSLVRRKFREDGKIHSDQDAFVAGSKAAAVEAGVAVIDLYSLSLELCDRLGKAKCDELSPLDKDKKVDTTHLKGDGESGKLIGELMANAVCDVMPEFRAARKH